MLQIARFHMWEAQMKSINSPLSWQSKQNSCFDWVEYFSSIQILLTYLNFFSNHIWSIFEVEKMLYEEVVNYFGYLQFSLFFFLI